MQTIRLINDFLIILALVVEVSMCAAIVHRARTTPAPAISTSLCGMDRTCAAVCGLDEECASRFHYGQH